MQRAGAVIGARTNVTSWAILIDVHGKIRSRGKFVITVEMVNSDTLDLASNRLL